MASIHRKNLKGQNRWRKDTVLVWMRKLEQNKSINQMQVTWATGGMLELPLVPKCDLMDHQTRRSAR